MVTTRQHPSSEEEQQLGEKGKQASKQEGPIAKKPKTAPLQEADKELEEGLEQQFSKEKQQLAGEAGEVEEEQSKRAGAIKEEEEAYEGGRGRAGGGRGTAKSAVKGGAGQKGGGQKGAQKGGPAEEEGEEEEEEEPEMEEEEEAEPEMEGEQEEETGKGKGMGMGKAASKGAAGGGKKSALGLQVGEPAPDFALKNEEGQTVALKDFKGQHVAIYFYNKDDTPVVNRGGAAFAKAFGEFEKLGVPLLFIGPDSVQSHKKFKGKAGLPFQLLSDPKKEVARKFHNLRGRNVLRTTVMIDPEGKVLKVWADIPENKVEANPMEALQFTQQLMEQEA